MEMRAGYTLWGRGLRMVLTAHVMEHGEATVAELVEAVVSAGHRLGGRPSKVISDALRWEVGAGRLQRIGRGRYAYVTAPDTTERRIRRFGAQCTAWLVAVTRGDVPPQTPPDRRADPCDPTPHHLPWEPPWVGLRWIWST